MVDWIPKAINQSVVVVALSLTGDSVMKAV